MVQINLFTKQTETHRFRKGTYYYQRGGVGGQIVREFGNMDTQLYLKWTNKDLL